MSRIALAFKSFFSLLFKGKLPDDVMLALNLTRRIITMAAPGAAAAKAEAKGTGPAEGAMEVLALLQREARLIDFLQEDISAYTDEQVGAAVRDVHKGCRGALDRHVKLIPVVDGVEGASTRLAAIGLDPTDKVSLRLVGNVPPDGKADGGILRHRGWKAERVELPPRKAGERVIAPAEVEVE